PRIKRPDFGRSGPLMDEVILIAGAGDPIIADLAAFLCSAGRRSVAVLSPAAVCARIRGPAEVHPLDKFSTASFLSACAGRRVSAIVLFLGPRPTAQEQALLEAVAEIAREKAPECICVVSSFRVHFGDRRAAEAETQVLKRLQSLAARNIVFRPSHVLS